MHNVDSYVRDFYFFRRNHYPQLSLVHMNPTQASMALQRQVYVRRSVFRQHSFCSYAADVNECVCVRTKIAVLVRLGFGANTSGSNHILHFSCHLYDGC